MKTLTLATSLALVLCAALLAVPAASAAGGPAILGGTYGAGGVTTPGSQYRYATVDAGSSGTVLEQIRTDGGSIRRLERIGSGWTLPAVTWLGEPLQGGHPGDGSADRHEPSPTDAAPAATTGAWP